MSSIKSALVNTIVEAIQEKKGENITILDMRNLESSVSDYFIICEGSSTSQVDTIADSVEELTRIRLKDKPLHVEGRENATWILLDYHNVIVHVFHRDIREFYSLETLWNDAERTDVAPL
jgi:ribosome-associated protein